MADFAVEMLCDIADIFIDLWVNKISDKGKCQEKI